MIKKVFNVYNCTTRRPILLLSQFLKVLESIFEQNRAILLTQLWKEQIYENGHYRFYRKSTVNLQHKKDVTQLGYLLMLRSFVKIL